MFLKTLALENVRCFESATVNFDLGIDHADDDDGKNRKWTVIVGENGGGKTTVLQSIALLMAGSDALPELLDDVDGWIRQGADEATISGELETAKGESRDIALVFRRGDSAQDVIDRSRETLTLLNAGGVFQRRIQQR
ncbi:MAG: AAA family ATPase [Pseudomonadota bacterium]